MMKEGKIILEAYFLGIKQYGYKYIDNNNLREKSPKNSLNFEDILKLIKGDKIIRLIPIRFFKSLKNLSINIKPTKITIKMNNNNKIFS